MNWLDRLSKLDRDAFEAAEKIPEDQWNGVALCVPPGDDNHCFFKTIAALNERYEGGDFPVFAWDCDPKAFTLNRYDAQDMVENGLTDHHEDAIESITEAQWNELALFLEGWAERVNIVSWMPNTRRAILLSRPEST